LRKLTAFESITLDGVMQAPGRPDEDTRGGFKLSATESSCSTVRALRPSNWKG